MHTRKNVLLTPQEHRVPREQQLAGAEGGDGFSALLSEREQRSLGQRETADGWEPTLPCGLEWEDAFLQGAVLEGLRKRGEKARAHVLWVLHT